MLSQRYLILGLGALTIGYQPKQATDPSATFQSIPLAVNKAPLRTQRPALNFAMYARVNRPVRSERDHEARQRLIHQLKGQLAAESSLLVPLNEPQTPRSLAAADRIYRRFVLTHRNSPVLPLFQQRHARSLLIDYGMLHTQNWSAIAYYTDQLVRGQSLDYPLITRALVRLKGHLPAGAYSALLRRATTAAEAEWHRQQQHIDLLNQQLAKVPTSRGQAVTRTLLQRGVAHLRADCIGPEVATLHRLAKSA